ncbi:hypothetical protein BVX93_01465, partial [bacterium B13(2017)]
MKSVFFLLFLFQTTTTLPIYAVQEIDILRSSEEWFDKFLKTSSNSEKIQYLTNAINNTNYKKWHRFPISMFKRAGLYKREKKLKLALKDYHYLIKKFKFYYEPYIEAIYIY